MVTKKDKIITSDEEREKKARAGPHLLEKF